ncbi:MAG: MmgE/PrpD family protein [Candidatus Bathyarchaeia archaeon]
MVNKITNHLANFVEKTAFRDLPKGVIEHAKLCVLDWLGAALAGCQETPARIVVSIIEKMGGKAESSIIGAPLRTSCVNAALANGIIGHIVEMDDIHQEAIIHPAAPVLPAALAIAERNDMNGKDLITAVVLGYEIEIRIGRAINPSHYQFWHTTGTCGTFGAVAAAGKLLGLDQKGIIHAFGIAGTTAAGLVEVFGTMSKPLNAGRAAMDGVLAAMLAREGFTSSTKILDSEMGYLQATAREFNVQKIAENLGNSFEIVNNIFKYHASCGHTHGAVDAVLEIAKTYDVKAEDVSEVLVGTYPIAANTVGKNYEPKTSSEAKFSLPYCIAAALIYRKVGLGEFSDEKLSDPEIKTLSKRVKVFVDEKFINARLGCAEVKIRTKSGKEYSYCVSAPKGYPENPLTKPELEMKFKTLASSALPENRITEILEIVNGLEEIDNVKNFVIY